jgi:hypothetical protein
VDAALVENRVAASVGALRHQHRLKNARFSDDVNSCQPLVAVPEAPSGTLAVVINKLAEDIARAMPELRDWLAEHGADPMSMTQAEFARFVLSESEGAAHQGRWDRGTCCAACQDSQSWRLMVTIKPCCGPSIRVECPLPEVSSRRSTFPG